MDNNNKPLYKLLMESIDTSEVEAVKFDLPTPVICIKKSNLKNKQGQWIWADRVCENFQTIEEAQYTALCRNNLHHLAEALQNFIDDNKESGWGYKPEHIIQAKEALKRISQ